MKAQLLMESLFALAMAASFVAFVLFLFAGIYGHYQSAGAAMNNMYVNARAVSGVSEQQARGA
jgi:hypothetical protein